MTRHLNEGTCGLCRWFSKDEFAKQALVYGQCRRFPPVRGTRENDVAGEPFCWPIVEEDDWCGEFSQRTIGASSR